MEKKQQTGKNSGLCSASCCCLVAKVEITYWEDAWAVESLSYTHGTHQGHALVSAAGQMKEQGDTVKTTLLPFRQL